jgi:hypothetical protein
MNPVEHEIFSTIVILGTRIIYEDDSLKEIIDDG